MAGHVGESRIYWIKIGRLVQSYGRLWPVCITVSTEVRCVGCWATVFLVENSVPKPTHIIRILLSKVFHRKHVENT